MNSLEVLRPARAGRALWIAGLVLVLLAVLLALLLRTRSGQANAPLALERSTSAPAAASESESGASAAERQGAVAALLALPDGIPIPVGVRLHGAGVLEGRVIERGSGAGVPGARVDLLPLPPAAMNLLTRVVRAAKIAPEMPQRLLPIATTGSDASGHFRFEGVRAGRYYLEARAARHVPDQARQVTVAASGAGGPLDVFVRPGGRVLGRVLSAAGRPLADAKVAIFQGPGALLSAARTGDLRYLEARSDESGAFVLCGIAPGAGYDLAATPEGAAVSHLTDLTVEAGKDLEVELVCRRGCSVAGRVLALAAPGSESEAQPIAGAHVGAVPRGLRDLHFAEEILRATHALTDAEGRYVMDNVPPGEFDVCAIADGFVAGKGAPLRGSDGQRIEAEPIALKSGPIVHGRVLDGAGEPVAGATVRWDLVDWQSLKFDLTLAPMLAQAVEGFDYPRTDAEGRFAAGAFAGDAPFRMQVFATGFAVKTQRWTPETDGAEIVITLQRGGGVEGVVLDAHTAEPVRRFSISGAARIDQEPGAPGSVNPFSGAQLVEDEEGRFSVPALEPGTRSLVFEADGYRPKAMEKLEIAEGQLLRGLIVELEPGSSVRGRVLDPEGEPVAGAQVFASEEGPRSGRGRGRRARGGGPMGALAEVEAEAPAGALGFLAGTGLLAGDSVLSAADGSFELRGLEPGAHTLSAAHRDFAFARSAPIELPAEGALEGVEIRLSKGGSLFGQVTDRYERPVPGAIVVVASPAGLTGNSREGGDVYQGVADAHGDYRIEHMQGGGYFVATVRGDQALNPMSFLGTLQFDLVTVPAEEPLRYDIVDRSASACRVHGRVLANGRPAGAGGLFALSFEGDNALGLEVKIAQVREDGSYEFPGLAPGGYQFTYQGDGPEVRLQVDVPDAPEYRRDLELPEGGLAGQVVSSADGSAVPNAEVLVRRKGGSAPTGLLGQMFAADARDARDFSDAQGRFQLARLSAGEYELEVRGPRFGPEAGNFAPAPARSIRVLEGQLLGDLRIELKPALAIEGVVRGEAGKALKGASVLAQLGGDTSLASARATADGEGKFKLRGLAEGAYSLAVSADGYAERRLEHVQPASAGAPVEVELVRGVAARARVLDASGAPLVGAAGRLQPLDSDASAGALADPRRAVGGWLRGEGLSGLDGWIDLGRHMPGRYRLIVTRGSARAERADVELQEGSESVIEVTLK